MRLIDADALMELIEKTHCTGCNNYNKVKCRACPTGDMLDYLDDAPTVDQWHYPSKGELPTENGDFLIYCKDEKGETFSFVDKFYSDTKEWSLYPNNIVIAWQYIVPPKEKV